MWRVVLTWSCLLLLCCGAEGRHALRTPRHDVAHDNIINSGTQFVFAFTNSHIKPNDSSTTEKLTLTFTNAHPKQIASVVISSNFAGFQNQTVSVPAASSITVKISPVSVQVGYKNPKNGTFVENKGIAISSSIPVTCLAENQHVDGGSSDTFTVFPLCNLGTQYKTIGDMSPQVKTNLYTVVATEDNTHVTFANREGVVVKKLARLQTATFIGTDIPTTNNPISADKKVAVVSGVVCGFGFMQSITPCNEEAIMLLPVTAWGRTYPFAPFYGDQVSEITVLPWEKDTLVRFGDSDQRTLRNETYDVRNIESMVVKGSKPIDVIAVGGVTYPDYMGAPFFTHVPAVEQFVSGTLTLHTGIDQHDADIAEHWVRIVQHLDNMDTVSINGWPISGFIYTRIGRTKYYYIDYRIESGKHTLVGTKPFGCMVYGYGEFTGYAYVPSLNLPSTGTC